MTDTEALDKAIRKMLTEYHGGNPSSADVERIRPHVLAIIEARDIAQRNAGREEAETALLATGSTLEQRQAIRATKEPE